MKKTILSTLGAVALLCLCQGQAQAQMLAGFDVSTQPGGANNYGTSPLAASVTTANLTIGGLTRGAGVGQSGTAAVGGFGGTGFTSTSAAAADTANQNFTFTLTPASGYTLSLSSFDQLNYRRTGTGPTSLAVELSINSGVYTTITTLPLSSTSTSGANLAPLSLNSIPALQNVAGGTTITFRFTPFGASSTGPFYFYDVANSTAADLDVTGTLAAVPEPSAYACVLGALGTLAVLRYRYRHS